MNFLEKNLEDIIFETDAKELQKRGLTITGRIYRQVNLGGYGIADLISVSRYGNFFHVTVYELKKETIDVSALMQAARYCKAIDRYLKFRNKVFRFEFSIVLIGKNIETSGDFVFLSDFHYSFSLYTYSYEFDGIRFNESRGWYKTNERFERNADSMYKSKTYKKL